MRHLVSLALSIVAGAAIFVFLGVGDLRIRRAMVLPSPTERAASMDLALGLGLLVAAGLCYGFLLLYPMSPAGPLLLGAAGLVIAAIDIVWPATYLRLFPARLYGIDGIRAAAPSAMILLAVPLVMTAFISGRWRRELTEEETYVHPLDATW